MCLFFTKFPNFLQITDSNCYRLRVDTNFRIPSQACVYSYQRGVRHWAADTNGIMGLHVIIRSKEFGLKGTFFMSKNNDSDNDSSKISRAFNNTLIHNQQRRQLESRKPSTYHGHLFRPFQTAVDAWEDSNGSVRGFAPTDQPQTRIKTEYVLSYNCSVVISSIFRDRGLS